MLTIQGTDSGVKRDSHMTSKLLVGEDWFQVAGMLGWDLAT
jgi:hypothetical protein